MKTNKINKNLTAAVLTLTAVLGSNGLALGEDARTDALPAFPGQRAMVQSHPEGVEERSLQ